VAAIGFSNFCCIADKHGGGTDSLLHVIFHLGARHMKLAKKLVVGLLVAFVGMIAVLQMNAERREPFQAGNGGGAQTEKLAWFVNRTTLPV